MSAAPAPSMGPVHSDTLLTIRSLVSSAWNGMWAFATTSPWLAITVAVPAVALLVACTRLRVHRD